MLPTTYARCIAVKIRTRVMIVIGIKVVREIYENADEDEDSSSCSGSQNDSDNVPYHLSHSYIYIACKSSYENEYNG